MSLPPRNEKGRPTCRNAVHLRLGCISVSAVTAAGGFALTASPFFKRQKGTKRLHPSIRCLA
ncbi:hypothetical protein EAH74_26745 [Pseudomonas mandelii]|uniref:Uncharacterized protein n=1 Tax=Pseudomonas mandelii TaxID=75612 RepID=A0A502HVG8_9PSED|nr:hypothetical protein EAH74_26745 [Pseudomonas mandelii]